MSIHIFICRMWLLKWSPILKNIVVITPMHVAPDLSWLFFSVSSVLDLSLLCVFDIREHFYSSPLIGGEHTATLIDVE